MRCTTCQSWEFTEEDLYCSWCGATLLDIQLSLDAGYVYVGGPAESLTLTIKHAGAYGSVVLESVESNQHWLKVEAGRAEQQLPGSTLLSGMQVRLPLTVNAQSLSDDYHEATISVRSNVGLREVKLEAVPKPKLDKVSTGGEHTVLLDEVYDERMTGYIAITRGVVTVEEMKTDVKWATVVPLNQGALPCTLDERGSNRLEFEFKINEHLLKEIIERAGGSYPVDQKGNLMVKFARLEPERTWPFYIKCFREPRLIIPEELSGPIKLEVFTDRRGEQGLTLQNGERDKTGHADLQILEIRADVPWLQPTGAITYPLTIPSGQYQHVTFAVKANDVGEGNYHAKLTFITNTPGPEKQKDIFIEVEVRQMPDFEGALAIDFGTSNSCCGFIDKRGRQGLIPIDDDPGNQKPTTAPSTILYRDLFDDGNKYYEIGSRAYVISFDPAAAFSAVRQVKRRLGKPDTYAIRFLGDQDKRASYTAKEVATDILKRILERAEETLKRRIRACTISHPSRFSLRQIDDLKSALVSCGIDGQKITTIHEPVGAAIYFISQDAVLNKYQKYHLMVYDFGGGTTDITLLRVENKRSPGSNMTDVIPKVLGATGDAWLGGENVTDIVMELAHEKCEQVLRAKNTGATTCIVPFDVKSFPNNPPRQSLAQQNRNQLRFWAERTKIAISAHGDNHMEELRKNRTIDGVDYYITNLTLATIVDNSINAGEVFNHKEIVPKEDEINAQLRPRIEDVVELMKRLAENNGVRTPEIILLSGKSSALPIVTQIIQKRFPESEIESPPDLKECVVRGACQISDVIPVARVNVLAEQDKGLSATTSQLGIGVRKDMEGHKFHRLIDAGMPIGKGLKTHVNDAKLKNRRTRISILENTGLTDELILNNGEDNPNIVELRTFKLEPKLIEWERTHGREINDSDVQKAEIELELTPNLNLKLTARIPGIDEPFEFEAEYAG